MRHFTHVGGDYVLIAEIRNGFLRLKRLNDAEAILCFLSFLWTFACVCLILRGIFQQNNISHCSGHFINSPSLGKVGPVGHNDRTQHHIVFGEVTVEQIGGSHHGHAEHIRHLHIYTHIHVRVNTFVLWTPTISMTEALLSQILHI